jgi:hypothetical protein
MDIRNFIDCYIGENIKVLVKTTIIIVLVVVVIVGSIEIYNMTRKDTVQTYTFVTGAQTFHSNLDESSFKNDFQNLSQNISEASLANSSDIDLLITDAVLSYSYYGNQFSWLYPTMDSLDLFESLLREGNMISSCFSRLSRAWSAKKVGDELSFQKHMDTAQNYYDQAIALRVQNNQLINDLVTKLENDIGK